MLFGGGIGGGLFAAGTSSEASRAAGLPFAGIPPELSRGVEKLLQKEPEPEIIEPEFSHQAPTEPPLTILRLIAPYRLSLTLAFFLVALGVVSQQIGPYLTKIAIDRGILEQDLKVLYLVVLVYFLSLLLNGLVTYGRIAWTGRVGENLLFSLRTRVFSHLQRLGLDFFTREKAGRIMTRMTSDIESMTNLLHEGMVNLLVQGLTMIFVMVVLFSLNVKLAFYTVLLVLPIMAGLTLWFRKASEKGYGVVRDRIADVLADFQENLIGMPVIRALNRQQRNIINHRMVVKRYRAANEHTAHLGAVYGGGTVLIATLGQALIIFIGGRMYLNGQLSIGELTAFVLYLTSFFAPIQQLIQLYNIYQQGQAALTKLRGLLLTKPAVSEAHDAIEIPPIKGEIRLEQVEFAYEPGQEVLSDINLHIRPGETIAFVGQTGAGKSTLAKLLIRFHDPTRGRIMLDGHDLRQITITSLRRQFGYVPQEPFLFSGTMFENIAFAREGATLKEVREACRAVGIEDLVERLPQGLQTPVHERGASLSSGERQLLALARAFLAQPRVIVLDEATSNLDLSSESRIEKALNRLLQGRTAIIIAHRLSTAMRADRIIVFHQGRIVETGTHEELLELKGLYASMYDTWMAATKTRGPQNDLSP